VVDVDDHAGYPAEGKLVGIYAQRRKMSSYPESPYDLLVIGGSGFVGAKIVQPAAEMGYRVAYTYNSHPLPLPIHSYQVDLVESGVIEACITEAFPLNQFGVQPVSYF
jgi:nucleoside-diphosphate-sugar epimerase